MSGGPGGDALSLLLDRPIAYHRVFKTITSSLGAAVFLSQAIYWQRRTDVDFFWKTCAQWEEETGLTRHEQDTARKRLRELELVTEKLVGLPARMHYRVEIERIAELVNKLAETRQTRFRKTGNHACSNSESQTADTRQGNKTTTETTTKNTTHTARRGGCVVDGIDFPLPKSMAHDAEKARSLLLHAHEGDRAAICRQVDDPAVRSPAALLAKLCQLSSRGEYITLPDPGNKSQADKRIGELKQRAIELRSKLKALTELGDTPALQRQAETARAELAGLEIELRGISS